MKKKDEKHTYTKKTVIRTSIPRITADALDYFNSEEAKITSSSVMKGGLLLAALGMMTFPDKVRSDHESLHVSWNNHANRAAEAYHINVAAINQHVNANTHSNRSATTAHSNVNTHVSSAAVNAHSNVNVHTSAAVVNTHANKVAINEPGSHVNQSVVKGSAHNSGAQGKHTAWKGHANNAVSVHTNSPVASTHNNASALSAHTNINSHASAGAVNTHRNHNNSVSTPAVNRHAHITSHSSAVASNVHASIAAINIHSNANTHGSHDSHSSW